MILFVALVALALLAPYVVGPFLVWRKKSFPATVSLNTLSAQQLPLVVRQTFQSQVTALEYDGFSLAAYLTQSNQVMSATTFIALLLNRDTGDLAVLIDMTSTAGAASIHQSYVELGTEYADGLEILTNSSSLVSIFRKSRKKLIFKFPEVRNPRALYAIHRRLLTTHRSRSGVVTPVEGGEIQDLARSMERDIAKQEAFGYYYLDAAAAMYRPTFKGAVLMTWRCAWPGRIIRSALERRASAAALKATAV